jgi:hypothetical protein
MSGQSPNKETAEQPVPPVKSEVHPSFMEFHKAFYDYLKHLSTLSTGSIVLLGAFLEKLFSQPKWRTLVVISIMGFLVSVVASVLVYSVMVLNFPRPGRKTEGRDWDIITGAIIVTWVGFLIGVISLAVFTIRNLY